MPLPRHPLRSACMATPEQIKNIRIRNPFRQLSLPPIPRSKIDRIHKHLQPSVCRLHPLHAGQHLAPVLARIRRKRSAMCLYLRRHHSTGNPLLPHPQHERHLRNLAPIQTNRRRPHMRPFRRITRHRHHKIRTPDLPRPHHPLLIIATLQPLPRESEHSGARHAAKQTAHPTVRSSPEPPAPAPLAPAPAQPAAAAPHAPRIGSR